MDVYQTIIRPLVTEKSAYQAGSGTEERGGAYAFEVHPKANKTEIKNAVEQVYGVTVLSVRTQNKKPKIRRMRNRYGRTKAAKKAIVVLGPNSAIDLF